MKEIAKNFVERVQNQINNLFGIKIKIEESDSENAFKKTRDCLNNCIGIKRLFSKRELNLNVNDSSIMCIYMYFLSSELFKKNCEPGLYESIYLANKALHGIDLMYNVTLPTTFFLEHPVGSVMGRAEYGMNFLFRQCCTVGAVGKNYPKIGNNVEMCANTMILGSALVEDFVCIAPGSIIKKEHIPSYSLVTGCSPNLKIIPKSITWFKARSVFKLF